MNFGNLRTILKYVPQFQGRIFVVMVDGEVLASPTFANLLLDLAVVRSLGIRVIFCFDASPQMESLAREREVELSSLGGTGITDERTRNIARDASSVLTSQLAGQFVVAGLRLVSPTALTVRPAGILEGADQLFRGRVDAVDAEGLRRVLENDWLPVIAPIGFDRNGEALVLEAEEVSRIVAQRVGAAKLIFACRSDDSLEDLKNPRQFSVDEVADLLRDGVTLTGSVRRKLRHARRACEEGIPRAHLVDGEQDGAILAEVFQSEGVGTMVYADVYRSIRRAAPADLEPLVSLMRHAVEDGQLAERNEEELREQLDDFFVIEVDGNLVGCGALHGYPEAGCGEVAALLVRSSHTGLGYGTALVNRLEGEARKLGLERIFALSTQAPEFFVKRAGYMEAEDREGLPAGRRERHVKSERNSRLFWKVLE